MTREACVNNKQSSFSLSLPFFSFSHQRDDNRLSGSLGFSQHRDHIHMRGVETLSRLHLTEWGGLGVGIATALVTGSSFAVFTSLLAVFQFVGHHCL